MRLACKLAFVLTLLLAANRSNAELPTDNDPLPFADIKLTSSAHAKANDQSSTSAPPVRPYGPFVKVDNLGDTDSIEFRGLSQFAAEDIREVLRWDPKFQAAARPSNNTTDFLAALESRVLDGFQSSGFAEAKVAVSVDIGSKRVVVAVSEGPRFRQGKIVVTGDQRVDARQLSDWLTRMQKPRSWMIRYADSIPFGPPENRAILWTPGENLNCTQKLRDILKAGVRLALIEQGFPYASSELEIVPAAEPGLADLHVKLRHVGVPSTIQEIDVEGLNRDTRERLLDYLEVSPGQRLESKLLDKIQAKLAGSCRYWRHRLEVCCGPEPVGRGAPGDETVKLKLVLEEFSLVPPLSEPLTEVDEVLRKTAAWINNYPQQDSPDLVFESVCNQSSAAGNMLTILPSAAAADGRVAINLGGHSQDWSFDHALFLGPQGLAVVDYGARQKFAVACPNLMKLNLKVSTDRHEDGEYAQKILAAWSASANDKRKESGHVIWTVSAEPVAVVYTAHRPDSTAVIEDGVLTIKSPDREVTVDANTGALIRITARDDEMLTESTVRMVSGGYDAIAQPLRERADPLPNKYDAQQPISSLLEFAVEQLRKQPFVASRERIERTLQAVQIAQELATFEHLLSQMDQKWLELQSKKSASKVAAPKFFLTATTPDDGDTIWQLVKLHVVNNVPGLADRMFPRGSWPWTLTRETAFLFLADEPNQHWWNRMINELSRLERAHELGPIASCCWVGITCRDEPNRYLDTLGTRVARCGLRQSTDENIRRDIELLVTGDTNWAKLLRKLLDEFAGLPEEEQRRFTALFPAGCATTLTAHAERRASQPQEPAVDALRDDLLKLWKNGLREHVEEQLRAHAAEVAQQPAVATQPTRK